MHDAYARDETWYLIDSNLVVIYCQNDSPLTANFNQEILEYIASNKKKL